MCANNLTFEEEFSKFQAKVQEEKANLEAQNNAIEKQNQGQLQKYEQQVKAEEFQNTVKQAFNTAVSETLNTSIGSLRSNCVYLVMNWDRYKSNPERIKFLGNSFKRGALTSLGMQQVVKLSLKATQKALPLVFDVFGIRAVTAVISFVVSCILHSYMTKSLSLSQIIDNAKMNGCSFAATHALSFIPGGSVINIIKDIVVDVLLIYMQKPAPTVGKKSSEDDGDDKTESELTPEGKNMTIFITK